mmetsp:Transcript_18328/g.29044  ORF Transcript_18328/g.29044 Transcript_18328/m.29044 type:complete len:167 (-) Transcript_18328:84-584(-)
MQDSRVNWLDLDSKQIEEVQHQKQENDKQKALETLGSLSKVESLLLESINALQCAEDNLLSGGKECGDPFVTNIAKYIDGLSQIGQLSTELDTMTIPIALCDYIDQGKNPELQMKQNYAVTKNRNNQQRARIVNAYALQKYLETGQTYFEQWCQQQTQTNPKAEME